MTAHPVRAAATPTSIVEAGSPGPPGFAHGTSDAAVRVQVSVMRWTPKQAGPVLTAFVVAFLGCAAPEPRQADIPISTMGPSPLPGAQTDGEAERLVMGATSCWMGGLWSDAVGEESTAPAGTGMAVAGDTRNAGIQRRCEAVLVHLYGVVDPMQYQQLRAVDPRVVDDLAARTRAVASTDRVDATRVEPLVKLLRAVADAERENVLARGAADDVKKDEAGPSTPPERAQDKTIAASALQKTTGIQALLTIDAGPLTHEARAIGLLCALDRLEIARKLPKHLKVLSVGGPFVPVFGVPPPRVPEDPTAPIPTGTWPGYLVDVAGAAGHAVPAVATDPLDREALAWGGVLQAFADRLRAEQAVVSTRTPLPLVLGQVASRLDKENSTLRALFTAEQRAQR